MLSEKVRFSKGQRVCIFKLPPTTTTQGYMLDDWKQMIFDGACKVFQKGLALRVAFLKKDGSVFAQTNLPKNPYEAIVKTKDSSRGYALRIDNPKGGYFWVGVVFRDRNDAFDFNVCFVDYLQELNRDKQVQKLKNAPTMDFSQQTAKIKIKVDQKRPDTFDQFSMFAEGSKEPKKNQWGDWDFEKNSQKPKSSQPWTDFFTKQAPVTKSEKKKQINLLDF